MQCARQFHIILSGTTSPSALACGMGCMACMQEGGQVYNRMEEGSVQDSDTEGVPTGPPKHWTLELCARYRLAEFCFLLIVLIVGAQDSSFRIHKQQYVPQVRQPGVIPDQKAPNLGTCMWPI